MICGIAIDQWKLPVFERRLTAAHFAYEICPGVTADTLLLRVTTDDLSFSRLKTAVAEANVECAGITKDRSRR